MRHDLATIDAMNLIHEKIEVALNCISFGDADAGDIQTLAFIAGDYLAELHEAISNIPARCHACSPPNTTFVA